MAVKSGADNYSVYRFMTKDLGLRGAELQVYAVIFSFTRAVGEFVGSRAYLADTVGVAVRTVDRAIGSLLTQRLITDRMNGGYVANLPEEYLVTASPPRSFVRAADEERQ